MYVAVGSVIGTLWLRVKWAAARKVKHVQMELRNASRDNLKIFARTSTLKNVEHEPAQERNEMQMVVSAGSSDSPNTPRDTAAVVRGARSPSPVKPPEYGA